MTIEELEYERRDNPICKICLCHCEKWKRTLKRGNSCRICQRNFQKVKFLQKKRLAMKRQSDIMKRSLIAK
jgi:hypothetical protein